MTDWVSVALTSTATLFVIVEPFAAVPLLATVAADHQGKDIRAIARRASFIGTGVLAAFAWFGPALLATLGLSVDSLRAAGGIVLLMTSLDMLRGKMPSCRCTSEEVSEATDGEADVAVVPLAIPLLAGPGAIATVIALTSDHAANTSAVLVSIAAVFLATYVVLRSASPLKRWVGQSALSAVGRLFGLLLAALSVQMLLGGLRGLALAHGAGWSTSCWM